MEIYTSCVLAMVLCAIGAASTASGQTAPAVSLQSLAGDWEYVISPPLKVVLNLRIDASGALTGTFMTPDNPPRQVELTNFKLKGKLLSYRMSSQQGTIYEVLSDDGTKMQGPFMWTRTTAMAGAVSAPPFVPLLQIAGDWVGPSEWVLRLRLDAGGALTGTIDLPEPIGRRLQLSDLRVSGRTFSYAMPDGNNLFEGTFSGDGMTVTATGKSTSDWTWQHARTAAQAEEQEVADNSTPTNGDWRGVADYTTNIPSLGLVKGTVPLTFHFRSNPASCTLDVPDASIILGRMVLTGDTVHIDRLIGFAGTFDGILSADRNHIVGTFTRASNYHWTGPVQIDFKRLAP